ncbi:MAG: hypothetical protein ACI9MR_003918 [Myxococcota bacterium]|jgi:hypothetical protein
MRQRLLIPVLILGLSGFALAATGCDDSGGDTAVTESDTADTTVEDTTPAEDTTPVEDTTPAEDTTPVQPNFIYPEGPYGNRVNDTIANIDFYDPWTGLYLGLKDFYIDPSVAVIVITSSAGWCTACMYESWDLVTVQEKYRADGLMVLNTLYEDAGTASSYPRPLFADFNDADAVARDTNFMTFWRDRIGYYIDLPERKANYPVLADIGWQLEQYFTQNATPLTMVVRTSDMKILYQEVGYNGGTIENLVRTYLYAPAE